MRNRPEQSTATGEQSDAMTIDAVNAIANRARPWHRLHASSYVAMLIGATVLFFVNVPGQFTSYVAFDGQEKYSVEFYVNERIEHGWPRCYLRREMWPSNWNWNSSNIPEPVSVWSLTEEATEFRWLPLLVNAAVGIVILVVMAIFFEYWRRQRRCLFQLRLSDLLIGTAVVAVAIAYGLSVAREYDRERAALSELGLSREDYVTSPGGPSWLRRLSPESLLRVLSVFDRVIQIDLPSSSELEHVSRLSELRLVRLSGARPSADEIATFAELPRLEALELNFVHPRRAPQEGHPDIYPDDAEFARGLAPLAALARLVALDVSNSSFGDESAVAIANFKRLRILDAGRTLITNQGLASLAEIESLEELTIQGEDITDAGMQHLGQLKRLRWLSLDAWDVTDQGLVHLADLKDLRGLDLRYTSVKGPGLKHLQGLLGLESFIPPLEADPAAISNLVRQLPRLSAAR